jgi:amino acid transporter
LGWQAAASTGTYLGGVIIQSVVALNYPNYNPVRWQGTLILYAVLVVTLFVNTALVRVLPKLEGVILILHIVLFFGILIPVVHLAPKSDNAFVWTEFTNYSGYSSGGLSWLIGQSASAVLFIGYDGACHMAEEVQNAAINVPRAMFFTIFIVCSTRPLPKLNKQHPLTTIPTVTRKVQWASQRTPTLIVFPLSYLLAHCFLFSYIYILYCFGPPAAALNFRGLPFIEIIYNATGSKAGTTAIISLLLAMYIFATFGFVASASRQAWAFSRDNGLPFSNVWKKVSRAVLYPCY